MIRTPNIGPPASLHLSTLLGGLAAVGIYVLAEILGDGVGAIVHAALRLIYAPRRGYVLLPLTWLGAAACGVELAVASPEHQSRFAIAFLALSVLGLLGLLTLRDGHRAARNLPIVTTRVPSRFGPLGRVALGLGGIACLAVAAIAFWSGDSREWEAIAGATLFGAALLYSAVLARLPIWVRAVLGAKAREETSAPPGSDER